MASPTPYTKRRQSPPLKPTTVASSGTGLFGKSVLFGLFLLLLPLFPSQAPEFVGETVFTKFWELIHLLFVGIAVAYGLFSRRSVDESTQTPSRDNESELSYVSRIFQVSSVFDDDEELDSSCEIRQESEVGKEEEGLSEYGEVSSEVRAWNNKYFQERSRVVVARPAYGLDGHVVYQPLGLPVRSLRSALEDGIVNEESEEVYNDVMDNAPVSPVQWHLGEALNYQSLSVEEAQFASVKSRSSRSTGSSSSSSSSGASVESRTQNRFSPSRSVSQESLNSNVEEEVVKEKSLEGDSSTRSSSPSLPPSPSLSPSPLPELVMPMDDSERRVSHSRHYSDGSLLEEDVRRGFENEIEGSKVRDRRTELFRHNERGSKSLNFTGESSRRGDKSRRSYPPVRGTDDAIVRRRDIQQKSDGYLYENLNNQRVKKGRSHDSLELTPEDSPRDEKVSESFPPLDVLFQPTNAKASRRAMRSSRTEKDVTRNLEEDSMDFDNSRKKDITRNSEEDHMDFNKSRKKELLANSPRCEPQSWRASRGGRETLPEKDVTTNSEEDSMDFDNSRKKDVTRNSEDDSRKKDLLVNSPRCEPQSWRASSKVPLRGKSVRTIRSDRHKANGDSSDDRLAVVSKVESRGRTKSRRQRHEEELSIVLHQEKVSETRADSEPEDDHVIEETVVEQPQVNLVEEEEEEEEAAWESQSNASHDHNEVDRKAGEFIAKFREQIRLQKLTSGEQPRGRGGPSIIRNSHFR